MQPANAEPMGRGRWESVRAPIYLGFLAVACCAAVILASLRHTGSAAFPIDDGYIYSSYAISLSEGHPFTYSPGEHSGGITSLAWYGAISACYILLAPIQTFLGWLAPPIVNHADVAAQAGRVYLAAYIPGLLSLYLAALGTRRLVLACFGPYDAGVNLLAWCAGSLVAADLGLVWGALSGLESTMAAAASVWLAALLIEETRERRARWYPLLAGALPFIRPDLLSVGIAAAVWLLFLAIVRGWGLRERYHIRQFALLVVSLVAGSFLASGFYWLGWGQPLPSSFYAKVGGLRLGERFFSAAEELLVAQRFAPFVVITLVLVSGLVYLVRGSRRASNEEHERRVELFAPLLPLLASLFYIFAIMLTLPWFGQEDRYLLPVHPLVTVVLALAAYPIMRRVASSVTAGALRGLALASALVLVGLCYLWATRNYVVEVRNIAQAHVEPALWLNEYGLAGALASEPIGAVRLFGERRTVDLVGLTTPATLGTYRDWARARPILRAQGARYLLFYPRWFDGTPPDWVIERKRFEIDDNRIAGDSVIALYELK